jgi:hypothetical protein
MMDSVLNWNESTVVKVHPDVVLDGWMWTSEIAKVETSSGKGQLIDRPSVTNDDVEAG